MKFKGIVLPASMFAKLHTASLLNDKTKSKIKTTTNNIVEMIISRIFTVIKIICLKTMQVACHISKSMYLSDSMYNMLKQNFKCSGVHFSSGFTQSLCLYFSERILVK